MTNPRPPITSRLDFSARRGTTITTNFGRGLFPERILPRGWSQGRKGGPTPLHPYDKENKADFLELIKILPAAGFITNEPTGYAVILDQTLPAFPVFKPNDFIYEMKNGTLTQLQIPSDIMWRRGDLAGHRFRTLNTTTDRLGEKVPLPPGAGSFSLTGEIAKAVPSVANDLHALFKREKERATDGLTFRRLNGKSKEILGYSKHTGPNPTQPTFADVISYLNPISRNFIVSVAKGFAEKLGITDMSRILNWKLIIIRYPKGTGFMWHIDGIADFDNHPGVVFNVAVGKAGTIKYFDLVNMLDGKHRPIRQVLHQGDITVLSGESRASWPHSVPEMIDEEHFTFGIKIGKEDLANAPSYIKKMADDPQFKFDESVPEIDFVELYQKEQMEATTEVDQPQPYKRTLHEVSGHNGQKKRNY